MRRTLCTIALILVCTRPLLAAGPQKGETELSIGGGATFPIGNLSDETAVGWAVSVWAGHYFEPDLALVADFSYTRLDPSLAYAYWSQYWEASRSFAGVKYLFSPTSTAAYFKLGVDYFMYRWKDPDDPFGNDWNPYFGASFGAGVQSKRSHRFGQFIELTYSSAFSGNDSIHYWDLRAGLSVFFGPGRQAEPPGPVNVP